MDEARPLSPESDVDKASSSSDCWRTIEESTQEIIMKVQATKVSDERRRAVVCYVQRVISSSTSCKVFPFGSVPLRTYLPDGDIDLTAVTFMNISEEVLANDVYKILEIEAHNKLAPFVVKDVQIIRADVKLVKCLVQNIIVDISFNQLGGLSTLCFLEKVSSMIGKDHLFKRSIILIKAWCYYESRILGAHHGLISTYALETLVLYIFNLFHSSLNGPLAVLFKFLDYFSKFDWDSYGVSLNGPVRISSLPEIIVERSEIDGVDTLLTSDFFKECIENYSVPHRGFDVNSRVFSPKHLNIVDPLKENNNLGRSVSKGNYYRIKSAFSYGARKLSRTLASSEEDIADEVRKFFSNTLDRHGGNERPDVHGPLPLSLPNHPGLGDLSSKGEDDVDANGSSQQTTLDVKNTADFLADLKGDYETNLSNLQRTRSLHQFNKSSWELPVRNGGVNLGPRSVLYVHPPLYIGAAFGIDEMPKPRGTGTYFPNANHYKDRALTPKARPTSAVRSPRSNGRSHESSFQESPKGSGMNGMAAFKELTLGEYARNSSILGQCNGATVQSPSSQRMKSASDEHDHNRVDSQFYQLKDEDDFPPLSDSKPLPVNGARR